MVFGIKTSVFALNRRLDQWNGEFQSSPCSADRSSSHLSLCLIALLPGFEEVRLYMATIQMHSFEQLLLRLSSLEALCGRLVAPAMLLMRSLNQMVPSRPMERCRTWSGKLQPSLSSVSVAALVLGAALQNGCLARLGTAASGET